MCHSRHQHTPLLPTPPSRPTGTPTAQRRSHCNSLSHLTAKTNLPAAPPVLSTCSKVQVANNHQCVPCLRQPPQSSLGKTMQANAIDATPNWLASPTQSGTGCQTSHGGDGPRLRQDDELPPAHETSKIQQSMDKIIS